MCSNPPKRLCSPLPASLLPWTFASHQQLPRSCRELAAQPRLRHQKWGPAPQPDGSPRLLHDVPLFTAQALWNAGGTPWPAGPRHPAPRRKQNGPSPARLRPHRPRLHTRTGEACGPTRPTAPTPGTPRVWDTSHRAPGRLKRGKRTSQRGSCRDSSPPRPSTARTDPGLG